MRVNEYWESIRKPSLEEFLKTQHAKELYSLTHRFQNDPEFKAEVQMRTAKSDKRIKYVLAASASVDDQESVLKFAYYRVIINDFLAVRCITYQEVMDIRRAGGLRGTDRRHDQILLYQHYPDIWNHNPAEAVTFDQVLNCIENEYWDAVGSIGTDYHQRNIYNNYKNKEYTDSYAHELLAQADDIRPTRQNDGNGTPMIAMQESTKKFLDDSVLEIIDQQILQWGPIPTLLWACTRFLPMQNCEKPLTVNEAIRYASGIDDYHSSVFMSYVVQAHRKLRLLDEALADVISAAPVKPLAEPESLDFTKEYSKKQDERLQLQNIIQSCEERGFTFVSVHNKYGVLLECSPTLVGYEGTQKYTSAVTDLYQIRHQAELPRLYTAIEAEKPSPYLTTIKRAQGKYNTVRLLTVFVRVPDFLSRELLICASTASNMDNIKPEEMMVDCS